MNSTANISFFIFFFAAHRNRSTTNLLYMYTLTRSLACSKVKKKIINKLVHATVSGHCVCINYLHDNELVSLLIVLTLAYIVLGYFKGVWEDTVRDLTNDHTFIFCLYSERICAVQIQPILW